MGIHGLRHFRTVLEVERKFAAPNNFLSKISANRGPPPFQNIQYSGSCSFEDIYYDHCDNLFSHGIWLRKRSGAWQAKVRCGGDMVNSQFKEISKVDDIRLLVERYSGCTGREATVFGLTEFARFVTHRRSWTLDAGFEIVLDKTDFGHTVGEVELQRVYRDDEDNTAEASQWADKMDKDIERFMEIHRWAFSNEKPVGKLAAYCALNKK